MDVIRAMSIIAVICIHVSATVLGYKPYSSTYNFTYALNQISRFSVPAFIFISGMGLTISYNKKQGYLYFLMKRLKKIIPQYFIWCLIYIFVITKNFNIRQDINYIIYGKVFYHFYFIPLIVEFYVIFPFIYKFIGNKLWLLISCIISVLVIVYTYYYGNITTNMWFWDKKNLLYWLFYFSLGGYIGKNREIFFQKLQKYKYLIFIMFICSIFYLLDAIILGNQYSRNLEHIVTFQRPSVIVYSVLIILCILSINWKNGLFMCIVRYISDGSYTVYLCHAGILYFCTKYYIDNSYAIGSAHFELKAILITFFGAIIINRIKKFL
ncbi:surface polysaccharide O-acyltransferase-like enzyme [Clostridium algifaecis]|uniref:Surface polysaccharide O-acyltransferase-like enzyme n=1 Tax=Clostridium algifaecis TaxID=1472040 RepID=A0ABS4KR25_9CLOT|nr:acyltransferase [Clostridium algifaecis]MBP2032472.1 surface polysaccharide O-acyltransferase-like enzyme [Clostridium algifaecis]